MHTVRGLNAKAVVGFAVRRQVGAIAKNDTLIGLHLEESARLVVAYFWEQKSILTMMYKAGYDAMFCKLTEFTIIALIYGKQIMTEPNLRIRLNY